MSPEMKRPDDPIIVSRQRFQKLSKEINDGTMEKKMLYGKVSQEEKEQMIAMTLACSLKETLEGDEWSRLVVQIDATTQALTIHVYR